MGGPHIAMQFNLCLPPHLENMIYKGLNEDDAQFLSNVAQKQAEMDGKRFELESEEIAEFRVSFHINNFNHSYRRLVR